MQDGRGGDRVEAAGIALPFRTIAGVAPSELRWFWALHAPSKPGTLRTDSRAATLDEVKAEFEASWKQWKAWAGLEKAPKSAAVGWLGCGVGRFPFSSPASARGFLFFGWPSELCLDASHASTNPGGAAEKLSAPLHGGVFFWRMPALSSALHIDGVGLRVASGN